MDHYNELYNAFCIFVFKYIDQYNNGAYCLNYIISTSYVRYESYVTSTLNDLNYYVDLLTVFNKIHNQYIFRCRGWS